MVEIAPAGLDCPNRLTRARTASLVGKRTRDLVLLEGGSCLNRRDAIDCCGERFSMLEFLAMRFGAERTRPADRGRTGLYRLQKDTLLVGACLTWSTRLPPSYRENELVALWTVVRAERPLLGPQRMSNFAWLALRDLAPWRSIIPPSRSTLWQTSGRAGRLYSDTIRPESEHISRGSFRMNVGIILRALPAAARGSAPTPVKAE